MKIDIFILLSVLNALFLIFLAFRAASLRAELEDKKVAIKMGIAYRFLDIKKVRPTEGAHIFVWDSLDKRAIPTLYKGTEEDWNLAKDKETRFTHFVELPLPEQN